MDWNLLACARHHLTYAPSETPLREHLQVATAAGTAWRCLRCGLFVLGEPRGSGPAEDAPVVLRGQLLRDAIVLRLLAVERLLKGLAVLFAAYGVLRFRAHADAVRRAFEEDLPLLTPLAERLHWNLLDSSLVHTIRRLLETQEGTLGWIAAGLALHGVLQLTEATGLWLLKRWGEYVAAVATSLFIPIEIYELTERVTWVRIGALIINIGAVVFIVYRKRLFGVRGGRAAHDAERHHESLLRVVEKAA
ncbi:hypothetical protein Rhe02_88610 [Rhizocola hellebori]|uniref:DUF2127 domain-containing protein n=1 Tax=Rhizocola hellebori TaxID=1392758 RepID=A0A8J3VKS8_9ACTN|nr:DUF2127 domain-containing protein [Rhizocola hellebori]GIH10794.1 hypothetical protein Rhe02_88610 [Rhizocola hellebori]